MGYRIDYAGMPVTKIIRPKNGIGLRAMVAAAFMVFCVMVRLLWPEGTNTLKTFLVPGELSVTEQAFSTLVTDLREGQTLEDSIWCFCKSVIDQAH